MPDVLFEAHSAAMNLAFYDGEMFPQDYRGDGTSWRSRAPGTAPTTTV